MTMSGRLNRSEHARLPTVVAVATVVGISCVLVVLTSQVVGVAQVVIDNVHPVVVCATAALSVSAGFAMEFLARVEEECNERGFGIALLFFGFVLVPVRLMRDTYLTETIFASARIAATAGVLALLLLALLRQRARFVTVVFGCTALVVAVGIIARVLPAVAAPLDTTLARYVVVTAWFATATLAIVQGVRRRAEFVVLLGAGAMIVAIANALRTGDAGALAILRFNVLNLVAASMWLVAALRAVRRARQQQRLRQVQRDHELRNVALGLAGVGHLVGADSDLGAAVRSELARLTGMLDGKGHAGDADAVAVVHRFVVLHRADGRDIRCTATGSRLVAVPADVLAQVIANLLLNCARHAPGSPVTVDVRDEGDDVIVTVRDAGAQRRVLMARPGKGQGVAVSRRLISGHGGQLQLRRDERGCVATVRLPSARAHEAA